MGKAQNLNTEKQADRRILADLGNTIPENATKPVRQRQLAAKDGLSTDPVARGMKELADPYFQALDEQGRFGYGEGEAGDSGHTAASMEEKNFKFFLIHNLTYLNRQLNGPIFIDLKDDSGKPTGKKRMIDCVKDRLEKSEKVVYADDFDPKEEASIKALYWLGVNQTQFDWLTGLFNTFSRLYREICREDWKPTTSEKPLPKAMGSAPAEDVVNEIMKRREALKARHAA